MESKEVFIVGAGVAGLSAGVYLQNSGFNVTIFEQHTIPGGLSTSWSRKGYLFEGGMHWLTGSSPELTLNRVWKEVGALKENNPIYNRDPLYTLIRGNKKLNLYRDPKKLKEELLLKSPQDKKAINRLYRDILLFKNVHMLVNDIFGVKSTHPTHASLCELLKMAPAALRLSKLTKQSYLDYVASFKDTDIQHLLRTVIGASYNALSFIYTLASFASGDCGYPEGGSIRLTQNMADSFIALGGKIQFKTKVLAVKMQDNQVCGLEISTGNGKNTEFIKTNSIIVTQDTRTAIDTLFSPPLEEKWAKKMRKNVISEQTMFICLGIKADLSKYPRAPVLALSEPLSAGGLEFSELRLNNYAHYEKHAPDGCTALTCLLLGQSYDWWKVRKEDGSYKTEKAALLERFVSLVEQQIPEIHGNIEASDVATPCTYERYTSSYKGGWMSVWRPGGSSFTFPAKSKNVKGLYFASERGMMPGGLPITVWAGRRAAQQICKDTKTTFVCPEV